MSQASEWSSSRVKAAGCSSVSRMLMRPSVILLLTFFTQVLRTHCRPANTDEVSVEAELFTLYPGKRLDLTCSPKDSSHTVNWTKDHVVVVDGEHTRIRNGQLEIEAVEPTDSGLYVCTTFGNQSVYFNVTVDASASSEDDDEEEERDRVRERGEDRGRRVGRGAVSESERDRGRVEDSYSDEGSSGEFGRFERYWEESAGGTGTGIGGIGGGGWFFGTYPSSINSRDDSLLGTRAEGWIGADFWGSGPGIGWASGGGSGGLGSQWPPPPTAFPPPRRYWSMDKIPVKGEKKWKGGGEKRKGRSRERLDEGGRSTLCSCSLFPQPHPYPHPHGRSQTSNSKRRASALSHSQEELLPHCHSFSGGSRPKPLPPKPDSSQAKSDSQSNLSLNTQPTDHQPQPSPSPPQQPSLSPTSLPMPIVPPSSSASVSPPAGVGMAGPAQASASAKLQYQRLRSVPQPRRFYSPHLPLKAKSLCSRRGSAHFSSLESEV